MPCPLPRLGCGGPSQWNNEKTFVYASQTLSEVETTAVSPKHYQDQTITNVAFAARHEQHSTVQVNCDAGSNPLMMLKCPDMMSPPTLVHAMPSPRLGCEGPPHEMPRDGGDAEDDTVSSFTRALQDHDFANASDASVPGHMDPPVDSDVITIRVQHEQAKHPIMYKVPVNCTAGVLTQAEARLGSLTLPIAPRSNVGTHLPLDQQLHPDQHVLLFQNFPSSLRCPFESTRYCWQHQNHIKLPCTRIEALWQQQAWVAQDEMNYYLESTQVDNRATPFPTACFLHEADATETAGEWLETALHTTDTTKPWCSAAIIAGHWIPIIITHEDTVVHLHTTPEGSCLLQPATDSVHKQTKTIEGYPDFCCHRPLMQIADSKPWNGFLPI